MTTVGTVQSCHRYPVKSMQGLAVDEVAIGPTGVAGDRTHGLLDVERERLLSAKRVSALLEASATDEAVILPDGSSIALDDPEASARLSEWLGREVELARPAEAAPGLAYEMTFDPPNDDAELFDIPVPAGTFLDLAAVHLVTTATLDGCASARPDLDWDVRRFRPNLVVAAEGEPFLEQGWEGHRVGIGDEVVLAGIMPTVRCAMPLRAQPGLEPQPGLFKAMSELNAAIPNHLGIYASVETPGTVRVGDRVTLLV
ncbi:MAG: MOSC domain-containing protein [Acidimicrobiales bacterium]